MAEITKAAPRDAAPKVADPIAASIDIGTQELIARAQKLNIDTVFDRAAAMKPCNIGIQGICCKKLRHGPLPLATSQGRHRRR